MRRAVSFLLRMRSPISILKVARDGSPRDFETNRRSLLRKIVGLDQRSSAPFLSGDTFKFLADYIFENDAYNFPEDLKAIDGQGSVIFTHGGPVSAAANDLAKFCSQGFEFPNATLIIHNCDVIPSPQDMGILARRFKEVFSVNWLGDPKLVRPLPIGLENRDKRRNGVPADYAREIRKGLPRFDERDINFLICFNVKTNPKERKVALDLTKDLPGAYVVEGFITPKQYRKLVLRSKFVISPPGAGPDCHRTWEAMYLGAIPIVKSNSWPFRHLPLPVIQLENWEELKNFSLEDIPRNLVDWKNLDFWFRRSG